jgi:hypothetical protein
MLLRPEYLDKVAKMGVVKYLEDPMLRLLADRMVSFHDRKMTLEPFAFLSSLEEESLTSLVAGWLHPRREENDLSGGEDGDVLLEDSLRSLVMRGLQKRKIEIQERMARCAPEDEEFSRLAEELRQTTMRLRHK